MNYRDVFSEISSHIYDLKTLQHLSLTCIIVRDACRPRILRAKLCKDVRRTVICYNNNTRNIPHELRCRSRQTIRWMRTCYNFYTVYDRSTLESKMYEYSVTSMNHMRYHNNHHDAIHDKHFRRFNRKKPYEDLAELKWF